MLFAGNTFGLTSKQYVAMAILLTGEKSCSMSYGVFLMSDGVMVKVFTVTMSVVPSGAAFATKSVPMLPLAPALFSTTTAWRHWSLNLGAITRARMSMPVPGENGTISVTGRLGNDCAVAAHDPTIAKSANHLRMLNLQVPKSGTEPDFPPPER